MTEPTYRFRLSVFGKETDYRAMPDALHWQNERGSGELRFADVRYIRMYHMPGFGMTPDYDRCIVKPSNRRALVLSSNHFVGLGEFESRIDLMVPFVKALTERAAAANPAIRFVRGMPFALWLIFVLIVCAGAIIGPVGLIMLAINVVQGEQMSLGLLLPAAMCLSLIIGTVPLAKWMKRIRPRDFNPADA